MLAILSYFIAIKGNDGHVLDSLDQYIPLLPPEGKFYADPFLIKEEKNYLFFEECDGKKGRISYVMLDEDGHPGPVQTALDLPSHLSFPSFFRDEGKIYMVPETYWSKSVWLFEAIEFPHTWKKVRQLVSGKRFSDPLLFKHGDYYWLFVAARMDRLEIYYAKDLQSRFFPHPINAKRLPGRNAGMLFGDLIRPTMDCSTRYGRAVILKQIVTLTPTEFEEREIATIEPTWAPHLVGTHTFCLTEDFVVYDGLRDEESQREEGAPLVEVSGRETEDF